MTDPIKQDALDGLLNTIWDAAKAGTTEGYAKRTIRKAILAHYIPKQALAAALDKLEKEGHGGGNWRRLLTLTRQQFDLEPKGK